MTPHCSSLGFLLALVLGISLPATAQTAPKGGAAPGVITTPAELLAGLPREVIKDLRPGSRDILDATAKATTAIRKNIEGKTASFKMTLRSVEKFQRREEPDVTRYRLLGTITKLREAGIMFDVHLMSVPEASENAKLEKLGPGSKVTVTGKITNIEFLSKKGAELHVDLLDAKTSS